MIGSYLFLANLFGPVFFPGQTPRWILENGLAAGFCLIVFGIFCIHWPRRRQFVVSFCILLASLILMVISVVVDIVYY